MAIGIGAVVAPRIAAKQFGAPAEDPTTLAWVRASGGRDLAIGMMILRSRNDPEALARTLRWSALIGLTDAATVASLRGVRPQHAVHLGGSLTLWLASR